MRLYQGAAAPEAFVIDVTPEESSVNFTLVDVDACTIEVLQPDGTRATWPALVSGVTPTTITLARVLAADGSDVPQSGSMKVYGRMPLTGGGGIYRSRALAVPVLDPFDADP